MGSSGIRYRSCLWGFSSRRALHLTRADIRAGYYLDSDADGRITGPEIKTGTTTLSWSTSSPAFYGIHASRNIGSTCLLNSDWKSTARVSKLTLSKLSRTPAENAQGI